MVPSGEAEKKGIKMMLWLQLLNANEGDTYLAWQKGGPLFENS